MVIVAVLRRHGSVRVFWAERRFYHESEVGRPAVSTEGARRGAIVQPQQKAAPCGTAKMIISQSKVWIEDVEPRTIACNVDCPVVTLYCTAWAVGDDDLRHALSRTGIPVLPPNRAMINKHRERIDFNHCFVRLDSLFKSSSKLPIQSYVLCWFAAYTQCAMTTSFSRVSTSTAYQVKLNMM
jgi:hypothetical protein